MYICIDRHLMLRVLNLSYTVTISAMILIWYWLSVMIAQRWSDDFLVNPYKSQMDFPIPINWTSPFLF